MIEIITAYTRSGYEWCCTCCQKKEKTKRIRFAYDDGRRGISVTLCDDCRRELVSRLSESEEV